MSDSAGMTRRGFARSAGAVTAGLGVGSLMGAARAGAATVRNNRAAASPGLNLGNATGPEQQQIASIAQAAMAKYHLKALIVRVTTGGEDTCTGALGESMTGVPATAAMCVRNGFIAYSYIATILLEFVDEKKITLGDRLSDYLPDLPGSDAVTIKMLANSTSGYADYVYQPAVSGGIYADPFRQWTTAELIKIGTSAPPTFPPGTNWAYSHTNYAILGTVLAKVGGQPLSQLMRRYIFEPMGLTQTQSSDTPQIPEPVLHTFSSERREAPSMKLAIAVITTYQQAAFDSHGDVTDAGPAIMAALTKALAPAEPIPS